MRDPHPAPRPGALSRRCFLAAAAAGLLGQALRAWSAEPSPPERGHRPELRLPAATANGEKVPIVVEVPLSMEPEHHITTVRIDNPADPVPSKGVFEFTAASGQAFVAFQARIDAGRQTVLATADCNRHGRFTAAQVVQIETGGGGCADPPPPAARAGGDEIRSPVIRIPQLVADGQIHAGQIIDVQLKMKHPNRTGLVLRGGQFVQGSEPFHLSEMEVFYGTARVSRFLLTSALSDNPFITFKLRAGQEGPLRVVLRNNRGQRFEAMHLIRFA